MTGKLFYPLAILLACPATVLGGGPPQLCLPIDGVTAGTVNECAGRIAEALGKRAVGKVVLRENDKQWYVLFHFNCEQVTLAELDQALKGSRFSIPRDKLRLFGHVMLEVKVDPAAEQKLLADFKEVKYLTIEESKRNEGVLFVTAVMPYPPRGPGTPRGSPPAPLARSDSERSPAIWPPGPRLLRGAGPAELRWASHDRREARWHTRGHSLEVLGVPRPGWCGRHGLGRETEVNRGSGGGA